MTHVGAWSEAGTDSNLPQMSAIAAVRVATRLGWKSQFQRLPARHGPDYSILCTFRLKARFYPS